MSIFDTKGQLSIFDSEGQLMITPSEIKELLDFDYIKADFYSCPAGAEIKLPDKAPVIRFEKKELEEIGFYKNYRADALIAAVADRINDFPDQNREDTINNIRLRLSKTKQTIILYQKEAYGKFIQTHEENITRDEFMNEYKDKDTLRKLVGDKVFEVLCKRDPVLNRTYESNVFSRENVLERLQPRVKAFVEQALNTYTAENYPIQIGNILIEVMQMSPEDSFDNYKEHGVGCLNEAVRTLDFADIYEIDNLYDFNEANKSYNAEKASKKPENNSRDNERI